MITPDYYEWIGAGLSVLGAWLVGGVGVEARHFGFLCFTTANVYLLTWAMGHDHYGIAAMQGLFLITSVRGIYTTRDGSPLK